MSCIISWQCVFVSNLVVTNETFNVICYVVFCLTFYLYFVHCILCRFFTSLTPPLSLSPLWISWAENEGAEGRIGVLYLRREPAAPLPGGRPPAAPCRVVGV